MLKFHHSIIIYESLVTRDTSNKQQSSKGKRKIHEQWYRTIDLPTCFLAFKNTTLGMLDPTLGLIATKIHIPHFWLKIGLYIKFLGRTCSSHIIFINVLSTCDWHRMHFVQDVVCHKNDTRTLVRGKLHMPNASCIRRNLVPFLAFNSSFSKLSQPLTCLGTWDRIFPNIIGFSILHYSKFKYLCSFYQASSNWINLSKITKKTSTHIELSC